MIDLEENQNKPHYATYMELLCSLTYGPNIVWDSKTPMASTKPPGAASRTSLMNEFLIEKNEQFSSHLQSIQQKLSMSLARARVAGEYYYWIPRYSQGKAETACHTYWNKVYGTKPSKRGTKGKGRP